MKLFAAAFLASVAAAAAIIAWTERRYMAEINDELARRRALREAS